ncbi:hypothetical protein SAMN05428989_1516 [Pseudoxanthomonas sp. GM95]|uniref:hypothetical protein n=1 Tax=Pseudoxanthomonas sp. GM95 TaxID=1881043 RepID=UPI0008CF215E|nr:hypothetical protein [Pseudoxanthomonas sp. GM95]SEL13341.1 hypothetical protein SAMN05428989_1516 [Pseudoxanthomonas sp. GM95]
MAKEWLVRMLVLLSGVMPLLAVAQVHVSGYFRKDGTYVAPHYRSAPNSSASDNYSSAGNINPFTGLVDRRQANGLQIDPSATYIALLMPRAHVTAPVQVPAVPAHQVRIVSIWKCVDVQGVAHYLAYPRAGCDEINVTTAAAPPPRPIASAVPFYFRGSACTQGCSGHEAGYNWAEENGIDDPDDCGGNSASFIEGCEAYAEEQQEQAQQEQDERAVQDAEDAW